MAIRIQPEVFHIDALTQALHANNPEVGAVVNFVGYVRDFSDTLNVDSLFLEHYPGMTEKSLRSIVDKANDLWPLQAVEIVHRIGILTVGEPIVFVGVASQHRQAAFEACAFIMDFLKTQAPFWKREDTNAGPRWVDARDSDRLAASRWV
ncbi:Molybdopterin synthase catalytic subunit [compost metagenome]